MEGGDVVKAKKAPSEWAIAVSKHIKAGGKFPKKGTADYDAVRALMSPKKVEATANKADVVKVAEVAPKKTVRAKKVATPEAVPGNLAKEAVEKAEKVLPIAESVKKVRKPRVVKEKVSADSAKPASVVVGVELPTAHVMPLARLGASHPGIKLPFHLSDKN
jgi:hypothetical protein